MTVVVVLLVAVVGPFLMKRRGLARLRLVQMKLPSSAAQGPPGCALDPCR